MSNTIRATVTKEAWRTADEGVPRLIADSRALVELVTPATDPSFAPHVTVHEALVSNGRAIFCDYAGTWRTVQALSPMLSQAEYLRQTESRQRATVAANGAHVLDPSVRFCLHAEEKTHDQGAWFKVDVRQTIRPGHVGVISFTMDAAEMMRMVDAAAQLVVRGAR